MTISKDRVKPSPLPDSWKLAEIFATGIVLGGYLAMMTVIFFWAAYKTDFFPVSSFFSLSSCLQVMLLLRILIIFLSHLPPNDLAAYFWGGDTWENCPRWLQEARFSDISASEHHQPGSHIRDKIKKLVVCWAPWFVARGCIRHCSTG